MTARSPPVSDDDESVEPLGFTAIIRASSPHLIPATEVPQTSIYPRLLDQLTADRQELEALRRSAASGPAAGALLAIIDRCLCATYGQLFDAAFEASEALSALRGPQCSPLLTVCIRILQIQALFSAAASAAAHGDAPRAPADRAAPPDAFDGDLIQCRICEQFVPLALVEAHMASCKAAFESSQQMREDANAALRFIGRLKASVLALAWPGAGAHATRIVLPVLHIVSLLERAAALDTDSAGLRFEFGEIQDRLAEIRSLRYRQIDNVTQQAFAIVRGQRARFRTFLRAVELARETSDGTRPQETTVADFQFLRRFSGGGYAVVYLAKKIATGDLYAIKAIPRARVQEKNEGQRVMAEKDIMLRNAHSQRMARLFYSMLGTHNLYLVMEFLPGGDLSSLLGNVGSLSEECVRVYAAQVVGGLQFLRSQHIIHRDIKPDNLLIDRDGRLKLIDFGLSHVGVAGRGLRDESLPSGEAPIGTPDYMAPEIILARRQSYAVDYWALGCIVFEMLTGVPPFRADTPRVIFARIVQGLYDSSLLDYVSDEGRDFISKLLVKDPSRRLGFASIEEIKQHAWFDGIDWDNLDALPPPFVPALESSSDTRYFADRSRTFEDPLHKGQMDTIEEDIAVAQARSVTPRGRSRTEEGDRPMSRVNTMRDFEAVSVVSLHAATISEAERMRSERPLAATAAASEPDGRPGPFYKVVVPRRKAATIGSRKPPS
jgi:serine/threonine protein kinase